ncbi:MAG TPA: type II secretion system secretin GspD [Spongiibacteraceae bacterium]|nr:type II secretion system secretin GspD [Spongiibacteraceae bacterium]
MRRPSFATVACLLALLAIVPTVYSQAPADNITINMRDADIRTLIQWISDQTGKNMVVHRDVQGKVTVLSAKPVSREEAYKVFLSVLQIHGFAAIETPEAVKIVPANIATQGGLPYRSKNDDDMVVQVFKANNISASELAQMLKPLASKEAIINADASSNMLLIADHANSVEQLQNLMQKMDRAGGSEAEIVHLQYANAKQVLTSLGTLFPAQGGGSGGPGQSAALPLNLSADERSNSVLLSGDPSKRAQVKKLIRQMDLEITGEGNTQVLYLQYANAKEVVPILKSIAQSVLKDQKDKEASFSVEASDSANAVVINAPPGLANALRGVVDKLDVRRAQVLVEALIVEVSSDIGNDLGVIWSTTDLGNLHGSGGVAAVNTLTNNLSPFQRDANGKLNGAAGGLTLGYYTGGNLQAAIRAVSTNKNANVLSTPTVVAIDNEPASLLVGQNVPLITGQSTGAASATTNPFTTIERKDIGISLEITPRINQGNTITLDIKQKVESIDTAVTASDIVTTKREIDTKALIKDDQILVLGGLISDEQSKARQKVPILGDLPLIGKLFSSNSDSRTKTNLMVFIHPVILRDDDRATQVSRKRYEYMQDAQEQALLPGPSTTTNNPPPPEKLEDFDTFSPVNRPRKSIAP